MYCYFDNINVKPDSYKGKWISQLINCINKYSKKLKLTNDINNSDIIFTIKDFVYKYENLDKIIVVISCQDNAICDSNTINNKKIKYIFEHVKLLNDPKEIITIDDNIMKKILNFNGKEKIEKYIDYNSKVIPILNTSYMYRRLYQENCFLLKDRKYDIVFSGETNYNDEMITNHRKNIVTKIIEFATKYGYTYFTSNCRINIHKYYDLLSQTKIFISPYGFGEFSLKDFECVCFGCHVIKPKIYFEYFELDLSNFDDKVKYALDNLEETQSKVNKNRKLFSDYSQPIHATTLDNLF